MMYVFGFSQIDRNYLSETGTNPSVLIKRNKITKEVICTYTYCNSTKGVTIMSDPNKLICVDSVIAYYDENGKLTYRIREISKKNPRLIDTFYYNTDNQLVQISTSSGITNQEREIGNNYFTYAGFSKVAKKNTTYKLSNGLIKNSVIENIYDDKGRLSEVWMQSNISGLILVEKYYYDKHNAVKKIENLDYDYKTYYKYRKNTLHIYSTRPFEESHKTKIIFNKIHQPIKEICGKTTKEYTYYPDGTQSLATMRYDGNMVSITQHIYTKE